MLIPPNLDTYNEVKEILSEQVLYNLCVPLKLQDATQKNFAEFLIIVTARYLELRRFNPKVLTPGEQETEIFGKFREVLSEAKTHHEKMLGDTPSTAKFYTALRNRYPALDDTMKKMLNPYMDEHGYTAGLLNNFFDVLIAAGEEAKNILLGKEKSDKSANYLAWWAAEIRRHWPQGAHFKFGLAGYIKGESSYKSRSCEMLHVIICKFTNDVTPENMETAFRKAINLDINEDPAKLILE